MTEYDLGKVVGDDGEAGNGIASITKTGTSGLVDTYTITYDDGDTDTFTVTNGSDASVTIQTAWGSTTSDSKVPSEKLTKDTLDTKIAKSSTSGLVKNDGTIDTNTYLTSSALTNYVQKSSTTGLIKNDGSIMTSGTGSSNYSAGNHTHSGYVSATKVTSWSGTVSDSNVPSEKLVKNSLDDKIGKSSTSGLMKNDGTVDTTSYSTFSGSYNDLSNKPTIPSASSTTPSADTTSGSYGSGTSYARSNHTHPKSSLYAEATHSHTKSQITDFPSIPSSSSDLSDGSDLVKKSSTNGLLKNDGSVMTGGTGSSNYAIGNHTHSSYVSGTKVTSWQSTPSDSNVPSEKLVKDSLDSIEDLIGSAITYIVGSGS